MIPRVHPIVIQVNRERGACTASHAGWGSATVECDPGWSFAGADDDDYGNAGGGFGVRRPLRFLAFKLQLDEAQRVKLAQILSDLKTERAQAAVDDRRTVAAFADAVSGQAFDATKAATGASQRAKSAERLAAAVVTALERIYALLTPEQRERFAYLIRAGQISL